MKTSINSMADMFNKITFTLMERVRRILAPLMPYLRNKYVVTALTFLVWMIFIDENNLISQVETQMKLSELQKDKAFYVREIKQSQTDLELLRHNQNLLEKFAREKYLMKKDDEEIFVFVTEDD